MTDKSGTAYGRNFDGTAGDVLRRLEEMLAATPPSALATRPMKRALLEAVVQEIRRLRAENAQLRKEK
jgi:hypothetical protein